jgi:hypothetical protein
MNESAGLRVADDERDHVAAELREHFAAGRLTTDELGERLAATYSARTDGELNAVTADLPTLPGVAVARRNAELAARRSTLGRALAQQTGAALTPFAVCTLVWAFSGHGDFWPVWVLLFALVPLLRNLWGIYGPAPELDRVETELSRSSRG